MTMQVSAVAVACDEGAEPVEFGLVGETGRLVLQVHNRIQQADLITYTLCSAETAAPTFKMINKGV